MTSAPMSASKRVHIGPAITLVKSATRIPSKGRPVDSSLMLAPCVQKTAPRALLA